MKRPADYMGRNVLPHLGLHLSPTKIVLIRRPGANLYQVGITINLRRQRNAQHAQNIPLI